MIPEQRQQSVGKSVQPATTAGYVPGKLASSRSALQACWEQRACQRTRSFSVARNMSHCNHFIVLRMVRRGRPIRVGTRAMRANGTGLAAIRTHRGLPAMSRFYSCRLII